MDEKIRFFSKLMPTVEFFFSSLFVSLSTNCNYY